MRVTAERLAGHHFPAPQLDRPRRLSGADDRPGGTGVIALASGAVDAAANVCYVLATRTGLLGLAVVITSLYPGMTVLLARWLLGERMRWLQRACC